MLTEYHSESMPGERLDRTDRALVAALQKNARISNKDLAELVGLAPSSCLERVRALRARGVIRGFHADIDRSALGRSLEAIVSVRVRPHSRVHVEAFWEYALGLPEVVEVFHVTGADDFLVHVGVADMDGLRNFVLDRLTVRPEVAHVESHLIYTQSRRTELEPLYE
jgi:DNA-binding Lrp family transcriptional regulator